MHIFNLDVVEHHTTLLSFPQCMHVLTFALSVPSLLILGFANNTLKLYDVEMRQLTSSHCGPACCAPCSLSGSHTCTMPCLASHSCLQCRKRMVWTSAVAAAAVKMSLHYSGGPCGCVRCSSL